MTVIRCIEDGVCPDRLATTRHTGVVIDKPIPNDKSLVFRQHHLFCEFAPEMLFDPLVLFQNTVFVSINRSRTNPNIDPMCDHCLDGRDRTVDGLQISKEARGRIDRRNISLEFGGIIIHHPEFPSILYSNWQRIFEPCAPRLYEAALKVGEDPISVNQHDH